MPKTPETMRKMFDVHVPYEIGRLDEMYRLMAQPDLFNFKGFRNKRLETWPSIVSSSWCPKTEP